jgi:alkanesulfonate monooxygenase SsuD/methylene tetrahydromethanopterin reductase-like flavin-dependent oxidoreductase (luciferase family)
VIAAAEMTDADLRSRLGVYGMPGRTADSRRAPAEAVEAQELGLGTAWLSDRRDMYADSHFTLSQLAEVAQVLPDHLIHEMKATGTPEQAADSVRAYFDAGADEVILHGSSPSRLAPVIDALASRAVAL